MSRTIKEATVKRYHYGSQDQLRRHVCNIVSAYNFFPRLKTLRGLTPFECICKVWTSEPERFTLNPIHKMPGLNTSIARHHYTHRLGCGNRISGEGGAECFSQTRLLKPT